MVEDYAELEDKQRNIRIEVVAGLTTFLTMAYIIFVNPSILSLEGIELTGVERMDKQALIAVTCLVSGIATIIVGIVANAPIAMAPGMGLNAFFATLLISGKMNWQTALGAVFLSGLFFLILTLLGLRKRLVEAIPESLISAIAVGIGLFITFMGLVNLGIVVGDEHTLVKAGPLNSTVLIGLFGLLVMVVLEKRKIKGGLVAGILAATVLAAIFGKIEMPERLVTLNMNLQAISFKLDILAALKWSFFGSIFTLMFIDMFDSVGTLVACCHQAEMVQPGGKIKRLDRLLGIDAVATMIGAVLGTSTTTSYIESAAGIEQGGRTGLTSIVTGILFLVALPLVPIVGIVPAYATAPALIMVGLFMMKEVKRIDFANMEEAFPAFIIIVMIALSYSISTGLAFGFVSFTIIKLVSGKFSDIRPAMWIIALLSVGFLTIDRLPDFIIGIAIGGLLGSLIGANILRVASHLVAKLEVSLGKAYLTILICFFVNSLLGFLLSLFAESTGSATLVKVFPFIMPPVGFLIQSWIINIRLNISFGRACRVSIAMAGIVLVIALVIGLIFVLIVLAAGRMGNLLPMLIMFI